MLDFIRQNAGSWLIKFILGAIVVVFIFWGIGNFRSQRLQVVAKVNGEEILVPQYQKVYSATVERYSQLFGGKIPEGFLEQINIKKGVLNALINDILVRQAAKDMGVMVTNEEVQQAIISIPAFQNQGVFDKTLYEKALRRERLTPVEFENQVRQQMLTNKLKAVLLAPLAVPDQEAQEHYLYENEEVNLLYTIIKDDECKDQVKVTDEELAAWYEKNKNRYETKPQVTIRYLTFSRDKTAKTVDVDEAQVTSYYEDHKDQYHVPERRKARHILIKVDQDADEKAVNEAEKKAQEILARLKKGESFEKLAQQYSDDPGSASKGGDLGYFTRGMMVKPFDDTVFSMKEGEISPPVRTRFGFHIIKLEKIEPAHIRPIEEVRGEIKKTLKGKKVERDLWNKANNAYDEIIQLGSLDEFAKKNGLTLNSTEPFTIDNPPAVLGKNPTLLSNIFALSPGELSSILQVPDGLMIAELVEKKPPYIPELKGVKKQAQQDFIKEKSAEICKEKAEKLLTVARSQGLPQAAKEAKQEVKETGFFKRTSRTADGRLPLATIQVAQSLYEGKIYPDKPVRSGTNWYILAFKAKRDPDPDGFPAKKEEIKKRLLEKKQQIVFDDWIKSLRAKADIQLMQKL